MIATVVTTPIAGIPIRLPPSRSTSKPFSSTCKASFHTVNGPPESLYEVLRVGRDANTTEIKANYRNLASKTHSARVQTCNCKASAVRDGVPAVKQAARRPESLYEVLRIGRDATTMEIKAAYRNLAKVYHPDCFHGGDDDDRDFVEINKAYELLSDPEARASYDLKWRSGLRRKSGLYSAVGRRTVVYGGRRWETDQCW